MKTALAAIGGFFDMLPGWLWASIAAMLVLHSCGQGAKIEAGKLSLSQQETKTEQAESALSDRIRAEAQTVAAAVQVARLEEQANFKRQQEKTDALRKENAAARADLPAAADRVRSASDAAAAGFGCRNLSQGAATADRIDDDASTRFKEAGRKLADRLLQVLASGDDAIRERNLCVDLKGSSK